MSAKQPDQACSGNPDIADYAIIGDCHTAALISREGSIDWYCPRRFDAPAVFCALLDAENGGRFRLAPVGQFSVQRRYRGSTNVLEMDYETAAGKARATYFMPVHQIGGQNPSHSGTSRRILCLLQGLSGRLEFQVEYRPTFDYARRSTQLTVVRQKGVVADDGGSTYLTLACSDVDFHVQKGRVANGHFPLGQGDNRWLTLSVADDPDRANEALSPVDWDGQLERTLHYWEQWAKSCIYRGPYETHVLRSALALRLLVYEPTGAVIAAPTTSLPEDLGGQRNWDYRYAWLRDASLTLYSLMTIGYEQAAANFFDWLRRAQQNDPTEAPQIVYTIDESRHLPEEELDNLAGYQCSRPVRVGNAAAAQHQLDIYGEVLTAAYLHYHGASITASLDPLYRHQSQRPSRPTWHLLRHLIELAASSWQQPDKGIWEVRGQPQKFLYSRLMCWAALDRGVRLAEEFQLPAPLGRWRRTRDVIRRAIDRHGYNSKLNAFTRTFDGDQLDAGALEIPRIGFLAPTDPRVQSTIKAIEHNLMVNGLVYRYRTEDGVPGSEATFTLCTFWLVDALALSGELERAHQLFEGVLQYANDVGLLSEEISPSTGKLLGNFPQGFTHMALIQSAVNLAKAAKHGAEQQPETEVSRATHARQAASEGGSNQRKKVA